MLTHCNSLIDFFAFQHYMWEQSWGVSTLYVGAKLGRFNIICGSKVGAFQHYMWELLQGLGRFFLLQGL